jgi:uncharacterized membrane protein YebE (DUF533 family)
MSDMRSLLEGLLGGGGSTGGKPGSPAQGGFKGRADDALAGVKDFGARASEALGRMDGRQGAMMGAAGGGLLGMLLGGGRGRGGGLMRMAGMAGLGMLAYRAYQAWQQREAQQGTPPPPAPPQDAFGPPALEGPHGPEFAVTMIRAMMSAALADGHMDQAEQQRIFAEMDRSNLTPAQKGAVLDAMRGRPDPYAVARGVANQAEATQVYLLSALACGNDNPTERSYLDALAGALGMPAGLREELDRQAAAQAVQG